MLLMFQFQVRFIVICLFLPVPQIYLETTQFFMLERKYIENYKKMESF